MGLLSNKISKDELKLGDHTYSWRTAYIHAHHVCSHSFPNFLVMMPGIYVGGGKVIQFTLAAGGGSGTPLDHVISSSPPSSATGNPCPRCGFHSGLNGVISSYIDCFLAGGELFLFEYDVLIPYFLAKVRGGTCTILPSDSPEDVLHRAHYLLEKGFRVYCLFKKNCEDFANYCKTGRILINHTNGNRIGQTVALLSMVWYIYGLPASVA